MIINALFKIYFTASPLDLSEDNMWNVLMNRCLCREKFVSRLLRGINSVYIHDPIIVKSDQWVGKYGRVNEMVTFVPLSYGQ